jgi:hypothetical protein
MTALTVPWLLLVHGVVASAHRIKFRLSTVANRANRLGSLGVVVMAPTVNLQSILTGTDGLKLRRKHSHIETEIHMLFSNLLISAVIHLIFAPKPA